MLIAPSEQSRLKRLRLKRLFGTPDPQNEGQAQWPAQSQWVEGTPLGYRRRARLAWSSGGSGISLGYRRRQSKQVADVEHCLVLDEAVSAAWMALRRELKDLLRGSGEILLGPGEFGVTALLRTDDDQLPELYAALERATRRTQMVQQRSGFPSGVALHVGDARATWGIAQEAYRGADGNWLRGPLGGFSQGHGGLNDRLVRHVADEANAKGASVLELYCGHGNLSVRLADEASSWVGVEQDVGAVEACRANLKARGLPGRVVHGDAAAFPMDRYDVVVLDPPRTGARQPIARLLAKPPRRLVYVSCHPATLARDVAALETAGMRVHSVVGFDMFPQTDHLEAVVTMNG